MNDEKNQEIERQEEKKKSPKWSYLSSDLKVSRPNLPLMGFGVRRFRGLLLSVKRDEGISVLFCR